MVNMRARSFFSARNFFNPSICPMDIWKRRRNNCSEESFTCLCSSAASRPRAFSAFSFIASSILWLTLADVLPPDQLGRQRKFGRGEFHGGFRHPPPHAFLLQQNLPGPDPSHPVFRPAPAFAPPSSALSLGVR